MSCGNVLWHPLLIPFIGRLARSESVTSWKTFFEALKIMLAISSSLSWHLTGVSELWQGILFYLFALKQKFEWRCMPLHLRLHVSFLFFSLLLYFCASVCLCILWSMFLFLISALFIIHHSSGYSLLNIKGTHCEIFKFNVIGSEVKMFHTVGIRCFYTESIISR
jgi:hypothetical protein